MEAGLYVLVLCGALAVGREVVRGGVARFPVGTLISVVIVGVPTAVQLFAASSLLSLLERDWPRTLDGQWWRVLTSLVVQDGGWSGALLNLVSLAVVGFFAEQAWGRGPYVVIALIAGIGAQFWGAVVQPVGAGNSVAVFGLAASVAVMGFRRRSVLARVASIATMLGGLLLLILGDLHGGAFALGTVSAVILTIRRSAAERLRPRPGRRSAR